MGTLGPSQKNMAVIITEQPDSSKFLVASQTSPVVKWKPVMNTTL